MVVCDGRWMVFNVAESVLHVQLTRYFFYFFSYIILITWNEDWEILPS